MTTQKRTISEFAEPGMGGPEQGVPAAAPAASQEVVGVPEGGIDREGAMAKADLYKLASYSHKLYEKIQEETQLEAWVQAKITKAADYIASVYHYLEYEMKFSEYGHHLDNSDTLSEGQKMKIKELLAEAKGKMKELKKSQAEKMKESVEPEGDTCPTCNGSGTVTGEAGMGEPRDVRAIAHPTTLAKADAYGRKTRAAYAAHKRHEAEEESMEESFGEETHKEKKEREAQEKAEAHKPRKSSTGGTITPTKTGLKHTAKQVDEAKPSAGLSKAKKSATVKKAEAGKDIGKPGKNFGKVAAKAAKEYGSKEKGEKVAAAAMWKNIKETQAYMMEKSAAVKKDEKFAALAEPKDKITFADKIAGAKKNEKKTVKESTDFTRMQDQLSRLNRNETHQLVESSEADQIRALTKRLLG